MLRSDRTLNRGVGPESVGVDAIVRTGPCREVRAFGFEACDRTFDHRQTIYTRRVQGKGPLSYTIYNRRGGSMEDTKSFNGAGRTRRCNYARRICGMPYRSEPEFCSDCGRGTVVSIEYVRG